MNIANKNEIKISVIIPVHNGSKFLNKIIKSLLNQSLKEFEVILVENNSTDNSLNICLALQALDKRICVFQSDKKGTSLARKLGVEKSKGRYIVFMDQDDSYINKYALEKMYNAIIKDQTQICVFGNYKQYMLGIKRKITNVKNKIVLSREKLLEDEIKGIFGVHGSCLDTPVWNKIYLSDVLKSAVKNIDISLYFAEDQNLNIWAFTDNTVKNISIRNEAYYVWRVGVGFSSSTNGNNALFNDYKYVKPIAYKMINHFCKNYEAIFNCYLESIYFQKVAISKMIEEKQSENLIKAKISEWMSAQFVIEAKDFFNSIDSNKIWPELKFLISDYTIDEYYEYCKNNQQKNGVRLYISKLINALK